MSRKYQSGKYKPKHPQKYEGDPTNIIWRSSWEFRFMRWCDDNPNVLSWSSEEIVIPYICKTDNKLHRYFVDFKIKVKDREGNAKIYLVEVKPKAQTLPPVKPKRKTKYYLEEVMSYAKNISKWNYAEEYCKQRGYIFRIITEDDLGL
jgi:hypothetical protein